MVSSTAPPAKVTRLPETSSNYGHLPIKKEVKGLPQDTRQTSQSLNVVEIVNIDYEVSEPNSQYLKNC